MRILPSIFLLAVVAVSTAARAEPSGETLALVKDFLIGEAKPEEAPIADLSVVRVSGEVEPVRRALPLAAGDAIHTGPTTRVTLRFLAPDKEVPPEVVVDQSSVLEIGSSNSVTALLGRLFATLKGLFTVITPVGQLGVQGTELEVAVGEGDALDVRALEGVVELRETQGGEAIEIRPLERLTVASGGAPSREPMAEAEVRAAVDWTSEVWASSQASYVAEGTASRFATAEERAQAFRAARFAAIWRRDPAATVELADIYNDWGEGERAVRTYRAAAAAKPELGDSAEFLANRSQANRVAGRLRDAEADAQAAVERRPDSARAHLALGNALADQAKYAGESMPPAAAARLLERSLESLREARQIAASTAPGQGSEARLRSAAASYASGTRARLATVVGDDQPARAEQMLREAEEDARQARAADPDDPFAALELGAVHQDRARLARRRGDEAASQESLAEAERWYRQPLARHPDMAPALYRLGTVWEDRGPEYRERAIREYRRSTEARPTFSPAYRRLGILLEQDDPAAAARYLDIYRKLTPDSLEEPSFPDLRGRELADAQLEIAKSGLRLEQIRTSRSPTAAGTVLAQHPSPGAPFQAGAGVTLTIAVPDGPSPMPDLIGLGEAAARSRIALAGLAVGEVKDKVDRDRTTSAVIKQTPEAGSEVSPGAPVDLVFAGPKGVRVPDVVGKTRESAAERIEKKGLALGDVSERTSCGGEGTVLSQTPEANRRMPAGGAVDLVLHSAGPDPRVMPQLFGLNGERAGAVLRDSELRLAQVEHQESEKPAGTVSGQSPAAGTRLPAGCPVALTLAKPIPRVEVPNLVGAREADVRRAFVAGSGVFAYLRAGQVVRTASRVREGTVLQQNPRAGARVRIGTRVNIWVAARSAEPTQEGVTVPNVVCRQEEAAYGMVRDAGLNPQLVDVPRAGRGYVVRQSPVPGTRVPPGTTVKLYVGPKCAYD